MDAQQLRKELSSRVVIVTFKKKDGDVREMHCTTNLGSIPEAAHPKGVAAISEEAKASSIRAFDVKAQGWRSFLVGNIISVS